VSAGELPLRAGAAILRRLARSSQVEALVLRGGLMMRRWSGPVPRPVEDLDFLARFPFDAEDTVARLEAVLRADVEDGYGFGALRSEVIWAETPFPGVRVHLETRLPGVAGPYALRIDTGFGDPMDPEPAWTEYDVGEDFAARVLACSPPVPPKALRRAAVVGGDLHGLVEQVLVVRNPEKLAGLQR